MSFGRQGPTPNSHSYREVTNGTVSTGEWETTPLHDSPFLWDIRDFLSTTNGHLFGQVIWKLGGTLSAQSRRRHLQPVIDTHTSNYPHWAAHNLTDIKEMPVENLNFAAQVCVQWTAQISYICRWGQNCYLKTLRLSRNCANYHPSGTNYSSALKCQRDIW